jgi:hypothetical protein
MAAVAAVVGAVIVGPAPPAGAHTTGGPPASNYRTIIRGIAPPQDGVQASVGPDGEQVELRVTGPARVVVLGYADEPYLRVDRRGVFENRGSPAVRLNRARTPSGAVATDVGPTRWVRISTEPVARWHDHRVHWMGGATPEIVREAPDRRHVIDRFRVPLRIDGTAAAIRGELVWEPPPATLAWYGLALGLGGAVLLAARWRPRAALGTTALLLAFGEALHIWGGWTVSSGSVPARLGGDFASLAAIVVLVMTAWWVIRSSPEAAAPGLVIAGLFALVAGGFGELGALSHSTVPTRLDADVARLLVAAALGGGAALLIAGATRLRVPEGPPVPIPESHPSS